MDQEKEEEKYSLCQHPYINIFLQLMKRKIKIKIPKEKIILINFVETKQKKAKMEGKRKFQINI